jgi:peptidoglycan/LPS O-acetylase OafA/YrhL
MKGAVPRLRDVAGEVLFLQNYIGALSNHTWSLAVEEHFYIAIALLLSLLLRWDNSQPFRYFAWSCCAVFASCLLVRIASAHLFSAFSWRLHVYGTHLRIDSLAFGSLVGYLWHFHDLKRKINWVPTPVLVFVGVLLISPSFASRLGESRFLQTFGFTLIYLGAGLFLLAGLRFQNHQSPVCKCLASMGAYSYSIYLWHMVVNATAFACFAPFANTWNYAAYVISYIVGALLFGYIMHRLIEAPSLAIRDRFFPSCQPAK